VSSRIVWCHSTPGREITPITNMALIILPRRCSTSPYWRLIPSPLLRRSPVLAGEDCRSGFFSSTPINRPTSPSTDARCRADRTRQRIPQVVRQVEVAASPGVQLVMVMSSVPMVAWVRISSRVPVVLAHGQRSSLGAAPLASRSGRAGDPDACVEVRDGAVELTWIPVTGEARSPYERDLIRAGAVAQTLHLPKRRRCG
jgi:hypothetical protein